MGERLTVAHLDHTTEAGGAELALLRMLAMDAWDARVVVPNQDPGAVNVFRSVESRLGLEIVRIGKTQPPGAATSKNPAVLLRILLRMLAQSRAIRRHPSMKGVDVVHANSTRSAVYGALAVRRTDMPFAVHLRDMVTPEAMGGSGFRLFTTLALPRADVVIANSQATLDTAAAYIPEGTTARVIPSASGLDASPTAVATASKAQSIGMVARIDPWKGQHLLISAFAEADLAPSSTLALAGGTAFGTESYLEELRRLATDLGVKERVEFLGHVDDVTGFIDGLDVCVQASVRPEPLGQNVLQYLSRGKVVVAANAGGPAQWIEHDRNGLLFELGSAEDLAVQLTRAGTDTELRDALARGALATDGLLDDDKITAMHEDAFRAAVMSRRMRK